MNVGESFIRELHKASKATEEWRATPKLTASIVKQNMSDANKRLLIFYTDGTLMPFIRAPFFGETFHENTQCLQKLKC